jgi:oxygen-dependent protoporphyrinogen oxidase
LVARVREELADICGVTAEPVYVEVNRWTRAMPQYTLGHLERLNQIEAALSRYGGLVLTGAGYRGVGIPDCIRDGAVAAERVVRYLSGERS